MSKVITIVPVRARRYPGWIGKDVGDVICTLPANTVLDVLGDTESDGLVWIHSTFQNGDIWVATSTPDQMAILVDYDPSDPPYDKAFRFVLRHEGGYISPETASRIGDLGGETKYGITKRSYPGESIFDLTVERAKEIYKRDFWDATGCNYMEYPLSLIHFDSAINCGPARAQEFLTSSNHVASSYLDIRRQFYKSLGRPQFIAGWMARVDELEKFVSKQ